MVDESAFVFLRDCIDFSNESIVSNIFVHAQCKKSLRYFPSNSGNFLSFLSLSCYSYAPPFPPFIFAATQTIGIKRRLVAIPDLCNLRKFTFAGFLADRFS